MIAINKEEAKLVRQNFPETHVVRTMRQKSKRHKYYCEESRGVVKFLKAFRRGEIPFASDVGERGV